MICNKCGEEYEFITTKHGLQCGSCRSLFNLFQDDSDQEDVHFYWGEEWQEKPLNKFAKKQKIDYNDLFKE